MAVEFSILLILIVYMAGSALSLLLCGWAKVVTVDAAREGARHVALHLPSTLEDKVNEVISEGSLKTANITKVEKVEGANYVTVTVEYDQPTIIPGLPLLLGQSPWDDNFHLTGSSEFKIEKT